ncbi:MAG TPA: MBOAT family O-acyltransferase [Opitutaceae bacterium]|nr:MBOAT family O-acyltransferase [Opitutaceae bacterium]
MIFVTYWYLVFALVTVAGYWLVPRPAARLGFLAVACAVFHYHFAGPAGVMPIIVLMIFTFAAGYSRQGWACIAAMVLCVAALCFYKYSLFILGELVAPFSHPLAAVMLAGVKNVMPGAPPLGISFFTFEFVHYLYEVEHGGEPIRNPLKFLLFAIFFPSLVAGPIKRYPQYLSSLQEGAQRFSRDDFAYGCWRIGIGFGKKVGIADNLTYFIDRLQPQFAALGLAARWGVFAAIAFRILMDFSGYSDIAIGFARLLGVRLPENFNWPYVARSVQDFWQRWHISLSYWIRDYVYIPLGGSRHGVPRRVFNGLVAFSLCGLWHGPAWHFVIWGLYHGVALVICATYRRLPGFGSRCAQVFAWQPWVPWLLTQTHAWFGWLLFFYPVPEALHMGRLLFVP